MIALVILVVYLYALGVFLSGGLISDRPDRQPKDWKIELFIVVTWPISLPVLGFLIIMVRGWPKDD